jgi:hypothetical protein
LANFLLFYSESAKSSPAAAAPTDSKDQTEQTKNSNTGTEMETDDVTVRFNTKEIMPVQCLVKLPSKAADSSSQKPVFMVS